jgi:hypothetical protein
MTVSVSKKHDTNDAAIRAALTTELKKRHAADKHARIIHEFGVQHGTARIDIAVVNGVMHGYEIKSDRDNLLRLPEQVEMFNSVFDQVTLVVGKRHLYDAIALVPDWWGIRIAKVDGNNKVFFHWIRKPKRNTKQDQIAIARLLWRQEALSILEQEGKVYGVRSKPRAAIYQRLSQVLDQKTLSKKVRSALIFREDWRLDAPLVSNGG